MAAVEVDEPAELVHMIDRVLQRRLPAGKQCEQEEELWKDPRETGEHFTWQEPRR